MRLATGGASVQLRAFTDHDASRVAFVRAVSLHRPRLRHGSRILGTSRIGKAFYLQRVNFRFFSLSGIRTEKKGRRDTFSYI